MAFVRQPRRIDGVPGAAVLLRAALHSCGAVLLSRLAAFFRSAANCSEHVEVQGPPDHDAASAALLYAAVFAVFALITSVSKDAMISERLRRSGSSSARRQRAVSEAHRLNNRQHCRVTAVLNRATQRSSEQVSAPIEL